MTHTLHASWGTRAASWTWHGVGMAAACALHCARAGQYNEQVFKALDFVLSEAAKAGMRVIVALTDYWKPTDSVQQARAAPPCAAFPRGPWGLGGGFCGG